MLDSNPCTSKKTCSECIRANPQCGWCMKKGNFSYHRCDFNYSLADHGCFDQIFFPSPSYSPVLDEQLDKRNYYGRRCECDAKEANPAEEEQSCIRGNDTKVCSGRGACRSSFNTIQYSLARDI